MVMCANCLSLSLIIFEDEVFLVRQHNPGAMTEHPEELSVSLPQSSRAVPSLVTKDLSPTFQVGID